MTLKKLTATAWFRFLRQSGANRCLRLHLYLCSSLCLWFDGWFFQTCPDSERCRQDKNNLLKLMCSSVKITLWFNQSVKQPNVQHVVNTKEWKLIDQDRAGDWNRHRGSAAYYILCSLHTAMMHFQPLLKEQHATSAALFSIVEQKKNANCVWTWTGLNSKIPRNPESKLRLSAPIVFFNRCNRANLWVWKFAMLCKGSQASLQTGFKHEFTCTHQRIRNPGSKLGIKSAQHELVTVKYDNPLHLSELWPCHSW